MIQISPDGSPDPDSGKVADALIHLYRGEVQRVNTWRNRLDTTPHWAIVLAAGIMTWVFSVPSRTHSLILVSLPLVGALMLLEAHRYQMHEIWRARLRLIEENFFADLFDPQTNPPQKKWMKILANDLRVPEHKGTLIHSIAVRLRRIYMWIFLTLFLAWNLKLSLHPAQAPNLNTLMGRARIGLLPGIGVYAAVSSIIVSCGVLVLWGQWVEREEREGEIPEEEPGYEWRREEDVDN